MKKVYFTLDERVKNIEKLILYLLLFTGSFISLSKPESNYFGNAGIIFSLGILLISFFLSGLYLGYLVIVITDNYAEWIVFFMEKNKRWIGIPIILLFIILSGVFLIKYSGYTLNQFIGSIMVGIVIATVLNIQKILNWIENKRWISD